MTEAEMYLYSLFGRMVLLTEMMGCFLQELYRLLFCIQLQLHFLKMACGKWKADLKIRM